MASSQSSSCVLNDLELDSPSCWCGLKAPLKISRTHKNPNRKFYACPNFQTGQTRCQFFVWEDILQSVLRETANKTRENELRLREDAVLLREYEAQQEKDKLRERETLLKNQEDELGRRMASNRIGRILLCMCWIVSLVRFFGWF
ncbi:uncharacterized protein At4g04775-like [Carya illinoinensis]|uniref:GRF-type domain-containing protein n=1 Tax=Carya illinoinensis TaxID=32201 RepID=A0A8T1RCA3_CARIL|nr:uncharacterized protein At4g04775-like [Carya illinoinensis]XP_042981913.1 uncharacterized protein At4g04775-like [Carya illinoinensis]KAG6664229.1 hypothetical protein CIPAW_02G078600 [Carya illinoinensis]